jgi:hypothetical protein
MDASVANRKVISGGVLALSGGVFMIDTEASASTDDLDTITGTSPGDYVSIATYLSTRDVVVKHGTGNLFLRGGVDFTLTNNWQMLTFYHNPNTGTLVQV